VFCPQTLLTSPTHIESHAVLQQYASAAHTLVTQGSHVLASLSPSAQISWLHVPVASPVTGFPAGPVINPVAVSVEGPEPVVICRENMMASVRNTASPDISSFVLSLILDFFAAIEGIMLSRYIKI